MADFHRDWLLEARREDSPWPDLQDAIGENVVAPSGPLQEIAPLSAAEFEAADLLVVGFGPAQAKADAERRTYGPSLQESFWRLGTRAGRVVLARVAMAPDGQGRPRVQALTLKTQALGTILKAETPQDRRALEKVLELVRTGRSREFLEEVATPGLAEGRDAASLAAATASLKARIPRGSAAPRFEAGSRWYSSAGLVRTLSYQLPGPQGPTQVVLVWHEADGRLEGLYWADRDGRGGSLGKEP